MKASYRQQQFFLAKQKGHKQVEVPEQVEVPVDSSLANLERLARERLGDQVQEVHHCIIVVAVIFKEPVDVDALEDLFPECHAHPISPRQLGLAWREDHP